jgi:hypothetical protein
MQEAQDAVDREHHAQHEKAAKTAAYLMLTHLAAIKMRKLVTLASVRGFHYRIRIDVISDRKAARLARKIARKGQGIK